MVKIDHLGNVPQFTKNILACFELATRAEITDGKTWYPRAIETLETIRQTACGPVSVWDKPGRAVPAICAVLSPRNSWQTNVEGTRKIVRAASQGNRVPPIVAGIRRNVAKAWHIAETGDTSLVSGPKVCSFFANLCGDLERVTIDFWAARACGITDEKLMSHLDRMRYVSIETAYRNAARTLNLLPAQLQAICWIVERGHGDGTIGGTNQPRWGNSHDQTRIPF
jgi:hypothetical protein